MEKEKGFELIKQGMQLIKEGCSKVEFWKDCNDCPFEEICDAMVTVTKKELFSPEDDF